MEKTIDILISKLLNDEQLTGGQKKLTVVALLTLNKLHKDNHYMIDSMIKELETTFSRS